MNVGIISTLMTLMGKEKEAKRIRSRLNAPLFETEYKYFGEFLERQEGYLAEKYTAFALVNGVIDEKYINDYQLKDFMKEIKKTDLSTDSYLMIADMVLNEENIYSVQMKDWAVFLEISSCCNTQIINRERILQSVKEQIVRSDYEVDDVMAVFRSVYADECTDKTIKALMSLVEVKPSASTRKKLVEMGMTETDISVLSATLLWSFETARKVTNALAGAFEALNKVVDEWTPFQKSFIDYFAGRIFPTKYQGYEKISTYLYNIGFCNNRNYKNVLWYCKSEMRENEYLFLSLEDMEDWKTILSDDFFYNNQKPNRRFFKVVDNNYSKDFFQKILEAFPEISVKAYVNEFTGYRGVDVIDNGYIDILTEWKDISIYVIQAYINRNSINGYELLKKIDEENPEMAMSIVNNLRYDQLDSFLPLDNPRGFIELMGEILARSSMRDFDEFVRKLLLSKSVVIKYFSTEEISKMVSCFYDILKIYPINSYSGISHSDKGKIFELYASEEEKNRKKEEKERKEQEEAFEKIKEHTDNLSIEEIFDSAYKINSMCSYKLSKELKDAVWNLVKERIPDKLVFPTEYDMLKFWEDALDFIRLFKINPEEFRKIVESSEVKEG